MGQRADAVFCLIFGRDPVHRVLHQSHDAQGVVAGRPLQHGEIARHAALFGRIEEPPRHRPADQRRRGPGKAHHDQRQHRIAGDQHQTRQRAQNARHEPVQPAVHDDRRPVVPAVLAVMGQRMGHVVGQDQETFDQRSRQHQDHRQRDVRHQRPELSADQHQPGKGDDRGQGRCDHRRAHRARRPFGGDQRRLAQLAGAIVGMFAHHDGVVHDDAQRQDQREQRDHVDRHADRVHHRHRRQQRRRDARRDPDRGAGVQKQEQQAQDQPQPHQRIVQKQRQPGRDLFRPRPNQFHRNPLRQGRRQRVDGRLHVLLHADRVARCAALDGHRDRRVAVDEIGHAPVDARVAHLRHVTDGQLRPVGQRGQDQSRDLFGGARLGPRAHARYARCHVARRRGRGGSGDGRRDLVQRDVVLHQVGHAQLDQGFGGGQAGDGQPRHPTGVQAVGQVVRDAAQLIQAHGARDHHVGDRVAPGAARDLGVLGALGQVARGGDGGFDLAGGAGHVPARLELQGDAGAALAGLAFGQGHALDRDQRGFQHADHRPVHIIRPGPVPADGHLDLLDDRVGKELRPEARRGIEARHHHHRQQQVGQRGMAHEGADQARAPIHGWGPGPAPADRAPARARGLRRRGRGCRCPAAARVRPRCAPLPGRPAPR